jgi:hypothetical protein
MTTSSGEPSSLLSEIARMARMFSAARERNRLLLLAAAILALIAATAYAQNRLNAWNLSAADLHRRALGGCRSA